MYGYTISNIRNNALRITSNYKDKNRVKMLLNLSKTAINLEI